LSINPLIIKVNKPSVKKIKGRDRNIKKGLITELTIPKIRLATRILKVLSKVIPGTKILTR
jgi:hypothetical protein